MKNKDKNLDPSFRSGQRRGFAAMAPGKQKEIARKGGLKISENREWMSHIGKAGGLTTQMRLRAIQETGTIHALSVTKDLI